MSLVGFHVQPSATGCRRRPSRTDARRGQPSVASALGGSVLMLLSCPGRSRLSGGCTESCRPRHPLLEDGIEPRGLLVALRRTSARSRRSSSRRLVAGAWRRSRSYRLEQVRYRWTPSVSAGGTPNQDDVRPGARSRRTTRCRASPLRTSRRPRWGQTLRCRLGSIRRGLPFRIDRVEFRVGQVRIEECGGSTSGRWRRSGFRRSPAGRSSDPDPASGSIRLPCPGSRSSWTP